MLSKEEIKKGLIEELERTITANECGLSTNDFKKDIEILEDIIKYINQLESDKQKIIDKLEEKQKEIDGLNQFYETYEINYEGQAVLIDRNKFKEVIGADKGFSILVVNALPSIEEN